MASGTFPVRLDVQRPAAQSRITSCPVGIGLLIRAILLIPHLVSLYCFGAVAQLLVLVGQSAILVTGNFPQGMFNMVVGYQGWFSARFELDGGGSLQLERFLVREERMRSELNSWCAWAETLPETAQQALALDKLVACQQIFTFFEEGEEEDARTSAACVALARWLAVRLEGIYQIDGQGFFDAAGSLLLAETSARAPA